MFRLSLSVTVRWYGRIAMPGRVYLREVDCHVWDTDLEGNAQPVVAIGDINVLLLHEAGQTIDDGRVIDPVEPVPDGKLVGEIIEQIRTGAG